MRVTSLMPRFVAAAFAISLAVTVQAAAPVKFSASAGEVRDFIAVSASVGYAGTMGGGLWKTSDAGANWFKATLPAKTVWKVSANAASGGVRLYAATETGLWRSTDSGSNWTQLTQDPTRAVAVSPGSAAGGPDTILFGVSGAGVYKSTDSGATIARSSSGLDSTDVVGLVWQTGSSSTAFVILQCNIEDLRFDPGAFEGPWGGVYQTTNTGASWTDVSGNLPKSAAPGAVGGLTVKPCLSSIVSVGTAGTPITVVGVRNPTDNQGTSYSFTAPSTWTASGSDPFGVEWLGPDISNTSGIFRATNQFGLQRSTNGNASYLDVTSAGLDPDFVTRAGPAGSFSATTWVASMSGLGLFRSTTGSSAGPNFAGPWSLPTTPIRADRVTGLTNHDTGFPARYYISLRNGGAMQSSDSGTSWVEFDSGLQTSYAGTNSNFVRNADTVGAHPGNAGVVGLGIRTYGLYEVNNGGTGWDQVAGFTNNTDHKPQSLVVTPGGKVFYSLFDGGSGTPGGLFKSTATASDLGTFSHTGVPNFDFAPGTVAPGAFRIRLGANPESRIYLLMYDSAPYRSDNGGSTWARVGSNAVGFQNHAFLDVAEKNAVVVVATTSKGIYRSLDGGANFSGLAANGLPELTLASIVYTPSGTLFGATFGGQMYCSVDDAANWFAVTGGNLGASVRELKYMNGAVHVITDGAGIWKKDGVCS